jgi:hypothetical protein
MSRTAVNQRV